MTEGGRLDAARDGVHGRIGDVPLGGGNAAYWGASAGGGIIGAASNIDGDRERGSDVVEG
jgi:hypothetical protein